MHNEPVAILLRLFASHFRNPEWQVSKLRDRLAKFELRFDFNKQLRELPFPGLTQEDYPALCYYYVPGTKFAKKNGHWVVQNPKFHADGLGLNMGCPVRLARALEILESLPGGMSRSARSKLENPQEHLSIVEELLWLKGWLGQKNPRPAGRLREGAKNVDWAFETHEVLVFLECKFRPTDWQLLTTERNYAAARGYLQDAAEQLPLHPAEGSLQLVGITSMGRMTPQGIEQLDRELHEYRHIHGVVHRTLTGFGCYLSRDDSCLKSIGRIAGHILTDDYPINYVMIYHGKESELRVEEAQKKVAPNLEMPEVLFRELPPRLGKPVPYLEEGAFRVRIERWAEDGEPHIELVPRYLGPQRPAGYHMPNAGL